jgi:hypothetical protein
MMAQWIKKISYVTITIFCKWACVYAWGVDPASRVGGVCVHACSQHRLDLLHFLLLETLREDGALARSHRVVFVLLGDGVEEAAVLRQVLLLGARLVLFNAVPAVQVVAQRLRGETEARRQQEEKAAHQEGHVVRLRRVVNRAGKRRTCKNYITSL